MKAITSRAALAARRVELGPGDGAVSVRIEPGEAPVGAVGATRLHGRPHLFARDQAVGVGVGGGQAGHTVVDELGLADPAVLVGVAAREPDAFGAGLRRRALGRGGAGEDAPGGGGQGGGGQGGGDAADEGLSHCDGLLRPRARPMFNPVER
jgi:hypothetical protein